MSDNDFRPRIRSEVHNRLRKRYFHENVNFSDVYNELGRITFTEDGETREWYKRAEKLSEDKDISTAEALNSLIVSMVNEEGDLKVGAQQLYARNDSIGE